MTQGVATVVPRPRFLGERPSEAERSRRRFARRQWARRWLVWRRILALVVVLGLVGGGVWAVYFSTALSVQGVEVSGEQTLSKDDVVTRAAVPTGGPLATVDLVAVERRVAALAQVRSVDVTRKWPHDVQITIAERVPVAVVAQSGTFRAVDTEGVVFNSYQRAPAGLPLIDTDITAPDALQEAVTVVAALPAEVTSVVDHVELVTSEEIRVILQDGREVRWGGSEQSEQKGEVLVALLQQPAAVYDVSVPGLPTTSGTPPSPAG